MAFNQKTEQVVRHSTSVLCSWVTLAALSLVLVGWTHSAHAQAVSVTNGTTVAVPGPSFPATSYTTSAAGLSGAGLHALYTGTADKISTIHATGVTITTTGAQAAGVYARTRGLIVVTGGTIVTTNTGGSDGNSAFGARVEGVAAPATLRLYDTSISTAGTFASGIWASQKADALADQVTILTTGANAVGVQAVRGGQITVQNGSVIATEGSKASGVSAKSNSTGASSIIIRNSSVVTKGNESNGLTAVGGNGKAAAIVAENTTVETFGDDALGVRVDVFGSSVTLDGGSVTTRGSGSLALSATNNASITATGTAIVTEGQNAYGAYAHSSSVATFVHLNNASVTTSGSGARGLSAKTRGTIIASGTSVTTRGAAAHGLFVDEAAKLEFSNGTITTEGADSHGLFSGVAAAGHTNTFELTDATIDAGGHGIYVHGALTDITLEDSALNAVSGYAMYFEQTAGATVLANASTINGAAFTSGEAVSNITLEANTLWNMTGTSNLTDLVNDNSAIAFGAPLGDPTQQASYKTLTVESYSGVAGTMIINTHLGGDDSPSDRLVISGGTASGTTMLAINNTDGQGGLTTGNGILVVDTINGGTTDAGAFALAGGQISHGPFEYTLVRSSRDGSNDDAWYLRSTFSPSVSLYSVMPSLVQGLGFAMIDNLHDRVGEETHPRGRSGLRNDSSPIGAWARVIGQHETRSGGGGVFHDRADFTHNIFGLQAGTDIIREDNRNGSRDHMGVYVAYGDSRGEVDHIAGRRAGKTSVEGHAVGVNWTHFGSSDWYVDAIAQVSTNDIKMKADNPGSSHFDDALGYALSIEAGYPIHLGGDRGVSPLDAGWVLEPQAQLVWQRITDGDGRADGTDIMYEDADSLIGRIGARLARTWWTGDRPEDPGRITAWARASVLHEFEGNIQMDLLYSGGAMAFTSDLEGTWAAFNAGVSAQIDANVSLYANANYNTDFSDDREGYGGRAGVRINW